MHPSAVLYLSNILWIPLARIWVLCSIVRLPLQWFSIPNKGEQLIMGLDQWATNQVTQNSQANMQKKEKIKMVKMTPKPKSNESGSSTATFLKDGHWANAFMPTITHALYLTRAFHQLHLWIPHISCNHAEGFQSSISKCWLWASIQWPPSLKQYGFHCSSW